MDKFKQYLERLYNREYYRLYKRAVNILGDFYLAEDVVEEVFVKIICHRHWWSNLEERDRIKYAERICVSLCGEFLRKREKIRLIEYREEANRGDGCDCIEQVRVLEREAMMKCLKSLKKEDQDIFIEKYFDGLSIKSIAALHNLSENCVSKRLQRGRNALKRIVK